MRVLVIGYGSMGRRHAEHAALLGHEVMVCDPVQVVQPPHYPWTGHVDRALEHGPEAVVLATPADTHADLFWQVARETTARVYVEKPLATGVCEFLRGLREFVALDQSRVTVGYNLRHHAGLLRLRALLPGLGPATWARFTLACDKALWPGARYADMLLEGSHELDLALWLFGPARVAGAASSAPDRWTVLLRHACGTMTTVLLDGTYRGYLRRVEVGAPRGVLAHDWYEGDWRWSLAGPGAGLRDDGVCTPEETYRGALAAWLGAAKLPPVCTLQEGLAVLRVCDEARDLCRHEVANAPKAQ